MTHAIRIHQTGDADALRWDEITVADPGPGQVRLQQSACGLNFIDIYMRSGVYSVPELPAVLGMEAAGVVDAIGAGVTDLKVGDRVAYAMVLGAYAESRLIDAEKLIKLPDAIDDSTAAAMMLKGLTAHYLLFRTYQVKPGDNVLVYAASGGVGSILCQWAHHLGATVIGCIGSLDKVEMAIANGCEHTILYREENVPERVRALTGGEGVAVVYDGVGKATFEASLDSLRPFGMMVSYGNSSGEVEPFSPKTLSPRGSLYVTRPTLATHTATRELLVEGAERLIDAVSSGILNIQINQEFPLSETAHAHRSMEAGLTTGSTVLLI